MEDAWKSSESLSTNEFMADAAALLVDGGLSLLAVPAFPEAGSLDYTLDSLQLVDAYLRKFRADFPEAEDGTVDMQSDDYPLRDSKLLNKFLVVIGAYAGEVIRRVVKWELNWIFLEDLLVEVPEYAKNIGHHRPLRMAYSLIDCEKRLILPFGIVLTILVGPKRGGEGLYSTVGTLSALEFGARMSGNWWREETELYH